MLLEESPSLPADHHRTWLDPQSPVSVQSEPKGEPRKLWFWLVGGLIVLSALFGGWAGWLFWRASQESAEGALPQRRIQPRKRTNIPQKTRPVPGKKRNPAIAPPSRPRINWSARAYAAPVECRVLAKGVRRRFHWIYAEVTPTQGAGVQWRFRECPGCRAYRLQGGGWCLGAFLTDKHVHIKLQMTGYQSCLLSVASDDQRLRLQLKRAKEQPLAPTLNGCRR